MSTPTYEVKFQTRYQLLPPAKQKPMAARGKREYALQTAPFPRGRSGNSQEQLKNLETCHTLMKVHIAQETSNGENFLQPLSEIKDVLEQVVLALSRGEEGINKAQVTSNIRHLNTKKLISYMPKIKQSKQEMGVLLLDVLCYVNALDEESRMTFPEAFASCLLYFLPSPDWKGACNEIMSRLCRYVLPTSLADAQTHHYNGMCTSSTLMMVLEGSDEPEQHLLVTDTLMQLKRNVCSDIMSVIAFGTSTIRHKALDLLLHYWPIPIPDFTSHTLTASKELSSPNCENASCSLSNSRASMLCLDAMCAAQHKEHGSTKLWMMLCTDCHEAIHGSVSQGAGHLIVPIPVPLYNVKSICEFLTCSGRDRPANVTCYDASCMAYQRLDGSYDSEQPIRMCTDCHNKLHRDVSDPRHIFQVDPPDPWSSDNLASASMMLQTVSKLIELVPVKKVKEVQPPRGTAARGSTAHHLMFKSNALLEVDISREGMWLLSHYCTPTTTVRENQQDWLVHLVALVLEWLQSYNDILREEEEQVLQLVSAGSDSLEHLDSPAYDYSMLFSNFTDVSILINSYTLPWFRSVCSSNSECVSEALKPDTPSCAQIGKLWNKACSSVDRHKRTLSILHSLFLLYRDGKLQEKTFKKIFNSVISLWMDVLVSLRSEPGHMDKLQDQFKQIFFYEKHDEGVMLFSFMLDVFRNNDLDEQQRALFWLQDLTRLGVSVPFLPHMCEDALTEKSHQKFRQQSRHQPTHTSTSSFDQEAEEVRSKPFKRESSASLSGYESESALVSQSSIEQGDTQMLVSLNSSLTRFILMLDTWLSQLLELKTSTLNYFDLQKTLVRMLRKIWGSNHTFQDHRETSNLCLLCRGMSLWFNLAIKLVKEYSKQEKEASAGEDGADFQDFSSSVGQQRPRSSLRQVITTPLNLRRRKFVSAVDPPEYHRTPIKNSPQMKKLSQGSISGVMMESEGYSSSASPVPVRMSRAAVDSPNQSPREIRAKGIQRIRPRRLAQVQSHSEFEVVSNVEQVPQVKQEEGHMEETTPNLYIIFQLCIDRLSVKLHPDTLLHIVKFITLLLRDCQVLELANKPEDAVNDCKDLFEKLWKCLETETSHVARFCVGLLFDCVQFLAMNAPPPPPPTSTSQPHPSVTGTPKDLLSPSSRRVEFADSDADESSEGSGPTAGVSELESGLMWKTVEESLTSSNWSSRFKAVEKITVVLQFMRSKDVMDMTYHQFHPSVQVTLAYAFCLLTQLIQDKNSNVCVRAKYCVSSISGSSLEALKQFLRQLFMDFSKYRTVVLQTLSLLDSKLPELHFIDVEYITRLLRFASLQVGGLQMERETHPTTKKVSDVSVVSGGGFFRGTPKVSTASAAMPIGGGQLEDDPTVVALVQRILSLLLRHLSRQTEDIKEPAKKSSAHRSTKRPSNLTYKAIARVVFESVSTDYSLEVLVETLKKVFRDLRCLPQEIRNYKIFAVFLNHIYPVLDHNVEFGQTKGLLPFLLKLLGYSAAPNQNDFPHLALEDRHLTRDSVWKECGYNLGYLQPKIQAPWLRVFFVILYKYIHNYSETEPGAHGHIVIILTRWCLEITLKTIETEPHSCQFVTLSDIKKHRPALQRQTTMNSFVSSVTSDSIVGDIPSVNITQGSPETPVKLLQFQTTRDIVALSPVPEAAEDLGTDAREEGALESQTATLTVGGRRLESVTEQLNKDSSNTAAPQPTPGLCMTCNKPTDEYTEEVIALASLSVGTCCHRMPHTVSGYLVSRIVPSIAKVIVPGSYSWQTVSEKTEPPPGSAMAVAKHLLSSILTQFADRRLFLYLFAHDYGKMADTVFQGIATSLADPDGDVPTDQGGEKPPEDRLYQFSAIKYFLSDAVSSQHFTQDVRHISLINLAKYMEILQEQSPPTSPGTAPSVSLTRDITLWDGFCKKLKNHNDVLRHTKAIQSFLRIIIFLLQNTADCLPQHSLASYHTHTVQSFMTSLASVVEPSLHYVYCPLGGLVKLASLWYKVFQQHLQRDSERFLKLYIGELRKALKARNNIGEAVRADNFLSLIQVLLLEEDGYLGYVDGLTHTRHFATDLKRSYETYSLHVIEQMQWDFLDGLNFLKTPNLKWPSEMIPQLKLTLAQLIALRVQRGRPPHDILKRLVNDSDTRVISASNPRSSGGNAFQPRWRDYLSALHLLSWLMLGAMCHNAINTVALEMRVEAYTNYSSGKCQLLGSLNTKMDAVTSGVIELALGALQRSTLSNTEDNYFGYLCLALMFCSIWTVYMELYVENSAPYITEFWQKFIGRLTQLLYSKRLDDTYRKEVIFTLNDYVAVKLKEVRLSSYSLLVPIWKEVTSSVSDSSLVFPNLPTSMATVSIDLWFKDTVKELVLIEQEWQSNVSSNATPS